MCPSCGVLACCALAHTKNKLTHETLADTQNTTHSTPKTYTRTHNNNLTNTRYTRVTIKARRVVLISLVLTEKSPALCRPSISLWLVVDLFYSCLMPHIERNVLKFCKLTAGKTVYAKRATDAVFSRNSSIDRISRSMGGAAFT